MSVEVWELRDSMGGTVTNDQEGAEVREVNRRYLIGRVQGFNDAVAQIEPYAPQYVNGDGAGIYWRRQRLQVKPVGNGYFDINSTYATLQPKQQQSNEGGGNAVPGSLSFDTTGRTEHITQALAEQSFSASGSNPAVNMQKAINVSGDQVQGLDVVRPSLRYSETWILPVQTAISTAFINALYYLTGTVNSQTFRAFDPGECLFMGARGTWKGDEPYVAVTFDFEGRPNGTVDVGDEITGIPKEGWEYLWVLYEPQASGGQLVRRPIAAYINQVYKKEAWTGLGIAGSDQQIAKPVTPAEAEAAKEVFRGFDSRPQPIDWSAAQGL